MIQDICTEVCMCSVIRRHRMNVVLYLSYTFGEYYSQSPHMDQSYDQKYSKVLML